MDFLGGPSCSHVYPYKRDADEKTERVEKADIGMMQP